MISFLGLEGAVQRRCPGTTGHSQVKILYILETTLEMEAIVAGLVGVVGVVEGEAPEEEGESTTAGGIRDRRRLGLMFITNCTTMTAYFISTSIAVPSPSYLSVTSSSPEVG